MLEGNYVLFLALILLMIPYCYVLVRVASIGYFHAKLRYHIHIVSTMKEEPDGQRKRA